MQPIVIDIKNVVFNRAGRSIFKDLSLEVRKGSITAIMGPSGTGKTSLLKLMTGLAQTESGLIQINEKSIQDMKAEDWANFRKKTSMLFQNGALFTDLSVFDNVAFPLREYTQLPERLIRIIVMMKLQAVGLRGAHALWPRHLSGGMVRRVALARAIALDPQLVLYDEPFAGQDPINLGVLLRLIKDVNRFLGATTVIVSHDVAQVCEIADSIYLLAGGRTIASGTPAELMASAQPEVQQFMKGLPDGPVPFHHPSSDYTDDLRAQNV